MTQTLRFVLGLVLVAVLTACAGEDATETPSANQQLGPLDWRREADYIILRVDQRRNQEDPSDLANAIPLCTLWGDGRLVWLNSLTDNEEVLEARLDDEAIRALIENIVFTGFYDWESNFILPDVENPIIQTITLNLYSDERTVSRYTEWEVDGFNRILNACTTASSEPVLFLPSGGWVSAYEVPRVDNVSYVRWSPEAAGFTLAEVQGGANPRWLTGDYLRYLWTTIVMAYNTPLVFEGDKAYQITVQVPNVTRDAPPAPAP